MSLSSTKHWKCDRCGLVVDLSGGSIGSPAGWWVVRVEHVSGHDLCKACAAALHRFLQGEKVPSLDRYRAALRAIVDYEPTLPELELDNDDCEECRRKRAQPYAISTMCSEHYRRWSAWQRNCELTRAVQHTELRSIARKALEELEP
jgi:hypothetical protein